MSINFDIKESDLLKGVRIIKPSVAHDLRGTIWTSFIKDNIQKLLPDEVYFKHDKFSNSKHNVLRGIHGDDKTWKLVTCVYGEIYQVVVDCRKESNTFKMYESFTINEDNRLSILIPPKFGNAFYVKSDRAIYYYKLAYKGSYIDANEQFSYKWNDPLFSIDWLSENPILSTRDK